MWFGGRFPGTIASVLQIILKQSFFMTVLFLCRKTLHQSETFNFIEMIQDFSEECYSQLISFHLYGHCSWALHVYLVFALTFIRIYLQKNFKCRSEECYFELYHPSFKESENNLSTWSFCLCVQSLYIEVRPKMCYRGDQRFFRRNVTPSLIFIFTSTVHRHYILLLYYM